MAVTVYKVVDTDRETQDGFISKTDAEYVAAKWNRLFSGKYNAWVEAYEAKKLQNQIVHITGKLIGYQFTDKGSEWGHRDIPVTVQNLTKEENKLTGTAKIMGRLVKVEYANLKWVGVEVIEK